MHHGFDVDLLICKPLPHRLPNFVVIDLLLLIPTCRRLWGGGGKKPRRVVAGMPALAVKALLTDTHGRVYTQRRRCLLGEGYIYAAACSPEQHRVGAASPEPA